MTEMLNQKKMVIAQSTISTHSDSVEEVNQNVHTTENSASTRGTYFVRAQAGDCNLKTAKDGFTSLIPQPSDDLHDPLNWSWARKHKVLLSLLLPSLLTDWGMTWGMCLHTSSFQEVMNGTVWLDGSSGPESSPVLIKNTLAIGVTTKKLVCRHYAL
jgi:hypothetical protein